MTFSAPKSVSVLFAIGDGELSGALVAAHEEAVDAAVAYIEQEACRVRRGHNGTKAERERGDPRGWERARSESADGFVAAAYRHRMSRAQDPQLHTHVVAANMAQGADGRWTALDAKHIYEHAKAGGFVYQAHLRLAVRERLPWAVWGPVKNGTAELEQIPAGVVHEFSTRRRRILERERELVAAGVAVGDAGRERIAFDTRETKRNVDELDWRTEVRARAAEHGLGANELSRLVELPVPSAPELVGQRDLAEGLFGPTGLTATANVFGERDVVVAVAAAAGQGLDAGGVRELSHRLLESSELVMIPGRSSRRFTTRELLAAEQRIVTAAVKGKGQGAAVVAEVDVLMTLSGRERLLSAEQERVVVAMAGSGNRIDTVEALAGTGKTTSAAALRAVYERAGYRVIGAAPTGRAVRELKEQAGIEESRTLDGWRLKLESDPDALRRAAAGEQARPVPTVMILDEAGMAGTRVSAKVLAAAASGDVKVVAFGDSGQLASVQAGGWLGALTRRVGSLELREVMRQRDPQERRGLASVHRGEPDNYLRLKATCHELAVFAGPQAQTNAEQAAIEKWVAARETFGPEQTVLICRDNQQRERLNGLARERLREFGELGEGVVIAGREWCVGDRVIARRNDRGRDLDNGTRGTVTHVDARDGLRIGTDNGAIRQIDGEYASHHLEYAYALTGHGMQGGTVEWAAVIGRPGDFTRNWSYTVLSRARESTEILLIDEPSRAQEDRAQIAPATNIAHRQGPIEQIAARMRERDDEDLAVEQLGQAIPDVAERGGEASDALASPGVVRVRELEREIDLVNAQLGALRTDDVKRYARIQDAIASLQAHQARFSRRGEWRDRGERKARAKQLGRDLRQFEEQRDELLARTPDPEAVRGRADELKEQRHKLSEEHRVLRDQVIGEELGRRPAWLEHSLGPEPENPRLRDRWQRTARQVVSYRLHHDISDPEHALGPEPDTHTSGLVVQRAISETRAHLGLELLAPEQDRGYDLDP